MIKHTVRILQFSHCKILRTCLAIFVIMHEKVNIETLEDNHELFEKIFPQTDFQS